MKTVDSEQADFINSLERHALSFQITLTADALEKLSNYYQLLGGWNQRLHLVAPCSPREFATRHVLESLLMLRYLPQDAAVADIGSGAGLPIVPCLFLRPDLRATLIESSKKKAIFLREVLRHTDTVERAKIIPERFESVVAPKVNFVSCRALDRFEEMLPQLINWSPRPSTLLLFGGAALCSRVEKHDLPYTALQIPLSEKRWLLKIELQVSDLAC